MPHSTDFPASVESGPAVEQGPQTLGSRGRIPERTIAAGEFKAKCLKILDEVAETREPITVTKFGKPVAQLVPIEAQRAQLRGAMRGSVIWEGDIISPLGEDAWGWFAEP
jgi:prevent-host-death family protein